MKNILAFVAFVVIGCSSCSKWKYHENVMDKKLVMTSHTWYLVYSKQNNINNYSECLMATEMTFQKDGTGKFYTPIPCDFKPQTLPFHWSLSADDWHIHQRADSQAAPNVVWMIAGINDDSLRVEAVNTGTTHINIYLSKKP